MRKSFLLAAFFVLIGVAVFVWGTAYKLSLYRAPEIGRAPAKLCTRASDASKAGVERAVDSPIQPAVTTVLVALTFASASECLSLVRDQRTRLMRQPRDGTAFLRSLPVLFRRPPPAACLRLV